MWRAGRQRRRDRPAPRLVRRGDIGACVGVEGYDVARLSDGVAYTENTSALQALSLPVPPADETLPIL